MVAAGLSGPARAAVGSVRDYVLGATVLNGRAEVLTFGGQVMKNVAGYDGLARLRRVDGRARRDLRGVAEGAAAAGRHAHAALSTSTRPRRSSA